MIDALRLVLVDCAIVIGGGLALALVFRFSRVIFDAIPMSRARRALVARLSPLAGAALALLFVVMAARWILRTEDPRAWIALAVVAAVVVAISWGTLRDVFEGIFLRTAHTCSVGDRVQIGAVRGRVQRLGLRSLHVEAEGGEIAIVPYRIVAAQPLLRTPGTDHAAFRVFRMPLPANRSLADVRRVILETALLSHHASITRAPEVVATDGGELEVTVFAVDPDRAPDLEQALRRALT